MQNFNPLDPAAHLGNSNQNSWMNALDFSGNRSAVPGTDNQAASGLAGMFGNSGLGMNLPTLQLGVGGLSALNSIFQGRQANKLANKQYNLARDVTNTNLTNQIQSYNTALEDRINSRAVMEGRDQDYVDEYIQKNRMSR